MCHRLKTSLSPTPAPHSFTHLDYLRASHNVSAALQKKEKMLHLFGKTKTVGIIQASRSMRHISATPVSFSPNPLLLFLSWTYLDYFRARHNVSAALQKEERMLHLSHASGHFFRSFQKLKEGGREGGRGGSV